MEIRKTLADNDHHHHASSSKLVTIFKLIFFCDIFLIMNNSVNGVNSQIVNFHEHYKNSDTKSLHKLVQTALDLKRMPEVTKMNISQSEYTTKYKMYLDAINRRALQEAVSEFYSLHSSITLNREKRNTDTDTTHPSTNLTYSNHSFQGFHELLVESRQLFSIFHTYNEASHIRWRRSLHAANDYNPTHNNNNHKANTGGQQKNKRKNLNNKSKFNGSENDLVFIRFELASIKINGSQSNDDADESDDQANDRVDAAAQQQKPQQQQQPDVQSVLNGARANKRKLSPNSNKAGHKLDKGEESGDALTLDPKDIEESVLNILLVRKQKIKKTRRLHQMAKPAQKTDSRISSLSSSSAFHPLRHHRHQKRPRFDEVEVTSEKTVRVHIYQLTEPFGRILLDTKNISLEHLKPDQSQWIQLNVKKAVMGWLTDHQKNLGLEIRCERCSRNGISIVHDYYSNQDQKPVLNIIAKVVTREKRAKFNRAFFPIVPDYITPPKRTSCSTDDAKKRCCRHPLLIDFHDISGFEFIIQPRVIDAGFCRGRCPPRYNPASHHAFLMSILNLDGRYDVPKRCCTALKLSEIDILHVDGEDPSKLSVSKWEDMRVMECACA